jgi:hypothetical protein
MYNYSFLDLVVAISSPAGPQTFAGQKGANSLTVVYARERATTSAAADGSIMTNAIAGNDGHLVIETQQTSIIHKYLLEWNNLIQIAANGGNISTYFSGAICIRAIVDGSYHLCTGVSIAKTTDKPYKQQGENVTWNLPCADIQSGG